MWLFTNPWGKLILFFVGNGLLGSAVMMIIRKTLPPPFSRVRISPVFSTLLLLIGMAIMLQFGEPELFSTLRGG